MTNWYLQQQLLQMKTLVRRPNLKKIDKYRRGLLKPVHKQQTSKKIISVGICMLPTQTRRVKQNFSPTIDAVPRKAKSPLHNQVSKRQTASPRQIKRKDASGQLHHPFRIDQLTKSNQVPPYLKNQRRVNHRAIAQPLMERSMVSVL